MNFYQCCIKITFPIEMIKYNYDSNTSANNCINCFPLKYELRNVSNIENIINK